MALLLIGSGSCWVSEAGAHGRLCILEGGLDALAQALRDDDLLP